MGVENSPALFLVLGPAGAGITTALDSFNRFGFLQVAGLSATGSTSILKKLIENDSLSRIAFSLTFNPEEAQQQEHCLALVNSLLESFPQLNLLLLDAPENTLIQRYLDSGKTHPLDAGSHSQGLEKAVQTDKKIFKDFRGLKNTIGNRYYSIDTSTTYPKELHHKIAKILGIESENTEFTVYLTSFGFKNGIPLDAELVFDMRFVTNPFYIPELRPLTGMDQSVVDYIFSFPESKIFLDQWTALMKTTLPLYRQQGKMRVAVAIGCTGGQHRSVCMTQALGKYLKDTFPEYNVVIRHREQASWPAQNGCSSSVPNTKVPERTC
jgi:UPF0042 nucleotide-binding protein